MHYCVISPSLVTFFYFPCAFLLHFSLHLTAVVSVFGLCVTPTRLQQTQQDAYLQGAHILCEVWFAPPKITNQEPRLTAISGTNIFPPTFFFKLLLVVVHAFEYDWKHISSSTTSEELASSPGCQKLCQKFCHCIDLYCCRQKAFESHHLDIEWGHLQGLAPPRPWNSFQHLAPVQYQSPVHRSKRYFRYWHESVCLGFWETTGLICFDNAFPRRKFTQTPCFLHIQHVPCLFYCIYHRGISQYFKHGICVLLALLLHITFSGFSRLWYRIVWVQN